MPETVSIEIGGRTLVIETGELAKQANGSALVRYGDSNVVLAAVTVSDKPREGIDFFPLTCEFEERMYAAGKIPGGYIKREGRPTEHATLSARQIDRPIRPLFPEGFRNDVMIVTTVLSIDPELDADVLAVCAAGAALAFSDIPFEQTVAAVRVGRDESGTFICNPTLPQYETGGLDLVVAGTADAVMMVEGGGNELSEEDLLGAVAFAHAEIKKIVAAIEKVAKKVGKAKRVFPIPQKNAELQAWMEKNFKKDVAKAMRVVDKTERNEAFAKLSRAEALERSRQEGRNRPRASRRSSNKEFEKTIKAMEEEELRVMVVDEGQRPDGRKADEIRPIACTTHLLPRVHGTGLFTRGQTQVLSAATLGSISDEQRLDWIIAVPKALHALLQLPAVFGRRDAPDARTRPPRNRPRAPCRARARAGAAGRGRLPVHAARRQRNPRVERFVLDGFGLRFDARADGCRRPDQEARRGCGDGPDPARQEACGSDGHSGPRRRARRDGLQGRGHDRRHHRDPDGHQGPRDHVRHHARSADASQEEPSVHHRQAQGRDARAA